MQQSHSLVGMVYEENEDMLSLAGTCPGKQETQRTVVWWCEDRLRTDAVRKSEFMPLLDSDLELWIVIFTQISSKTMNWFEFCISWDWFCWFWGCIVEFNLPGLVTTPQLISVLNGHSSNDFVRKNKPSRSVQATNWRRVPKLKTKQKAWCLFACLPARSTQDTLLFPGILKFS